jgi:hypothetical protein
MYGTLFTCSTRKIICVPQRLFRFIYQSSPNNQDLTLALVIETKNTYSDLEHPNPYPCLRRFAAISVKYKVCRLFLTCTCNQVMMLSVVWISAFALAHACCMPHLESHSAPSDMAAPALTIIYQKKPSTITIAKLPSH